MSPTRGPTTRKILGSATQMDPGSRWKPRHKEGWEKQNQHCTLQVHVDSSTVSVDCHLEAPDEVLALSSSDKRIGRITCTASSIT